MTSSLVVPFRASSAAVPVMVQFGPALTTVFRIPCAKPGPTIRPTVATETKRLRSFTCRSSLAKGFRFSPTELHTERVVLVRSPQNRAGTATSSQGGGVSLLFPKLGVGHG